MKQKQKSRPPRDARRIMRVADLPAERGEAEYEIRNEGEKPRTVRLRKRQRQIMDLLMQAPVYCASPVRISDIVHILKRDWGLVVETEYYLSDEQTGSGAYGVYFLKSRVRRIPTARREAA